MKKTTYLKFASVVLLVLLLGIYIGYSATPSNPIWISSGAYPSGMSYTIWRDGGNYFAKNRYGRIIYDGAVLSTVHSSVVSALSSGGEIHYARGTFILTAPLTYTSYITISGEGTGTILYAGNNMNDDVITNGTGGNIFGVTIKDLSINGNKANQNPATHDGIGDGVGVVFDGCQRSTIQNVHIINMEVWGIAVVRGTRNTVIDVKIDSPDYDGIIIGAGESYTKVIGAYVINAGGSGVAGDGISLYNGVFHSEIDSSYSVNSLGHGLAIVSLSPSYNDQCYDNIISNSFSVDSGGHGIYVGMGESKPTLDTPYNTISNNKIYNPNGSGIFLNETDYATVSGNLIYDAGDPVGYSGIWIKLSVHASITGNNIYSSLWSGILIEDSNSSTYTGNILHSNAQWGLNETGSSDYNNILGSNAFDNGVGGFTISGANTEVNLCFNGTSPGWIEH